MDLRDRETAAAVEDLEVRQMELEAKRKRLEQVKNITFRLPSSFPISFLDLFLSHSELFLHLFPSGNSPKPGTHELKMLLLLLFAPAPLEGAGAHGTGSRRGGRDEDEEGRKRGGEICKAVTQH